MTSPRQRRCHKNEMTVQEQKHFRSVALETRDYQLDQVAPQAEEILRDARVTLLDKFCAPDEIDVGDDEMSDSSAHSSDISASILTQDLSSSNSFCSDDLHFETGDDAPLPPFDPHMHATTVRTRKRSGKKNTTDNRSRRKRRRRPDGTSFRDDTDMEDMRSTGRAPERQKRRRPRKEDSLKPNNESDSSLISDHDHSLSEGGSLSFESVEDEPLAPQRRRRVARSRPGGDRKQTGLPFPREREIHSSRVPVADRMQAFLDANSGNIEDFDGFSYMSDASQEEKAGFRRQQRRERHARLGEPVSKRARASSEDAIASFDEDDLPPERDEESANSQTNIPANAFYRRLVRKKRAPMMMTPPTTTHETRVHPTASLSDSCRILLTSYRDSAEGYAALFNSIVLHFKAQTSIIRSEAAEVFEVLVQLLQEHGSMILQAVVLTKSCTLKRHIQLLTFALNLLECKAHTALANDDGLAFKLFGRDNWKVFVEMIVLQMMDVIYARAQPAWWGLDSVPLSGVIEQLSPLRDSIGRLVPLVETVSQCTLEKLQCQNWRQLGDSSDALFVSALDPREYKSLLLTGSMSPSVVDQGKYARDHYSQLNRNHLTIYCCIRQVL